MHVVRLDRFAETADERLEIDILALLIKWSGLLRLGDTRFLRMCFRVCGASGKNQCRAQDQAAKNSRFHNGETDG